MTRMFDIRDRVPSSRKHSPKLRRKQLARQRWTYTGQQPSGQHPQPIGKQRPERRAPFNPEQRSGLNTTFLSPLLAGFLPKQPTEFVGKFLSRLLGEPRPELPGRQSREQLGGLPPGWGSELADSGITSQSSGSYARKPPIRLVALLVYKLQTWAPPVRNSLPTSYPPNAGTENTKAGLRPPLRHFYLLTATC